MTDQQHVPDADAPAAKPPRSAALVFTQSVLLLEAFVALFATLVAWSFAHNGLIDAAPGWVLGGGVALMLLLGYASGQQKKRWGRLLGWILQAPLLLAGLLLPAIAVVGVVFLVIWIMGVRLGGRIDRERAERDAAAQERGAEDAG